MTDYVKSLFGGGVKLRRDVIHDHYIRRRKEREKQVGKEGVSTRKSYCPLGVLPWELIKSGTRAMLRQRMNMTQAGLEPSTLG